MREAWLTDAPLRRLGTPVRENLALMRVGGDSSSPTWTSSWLYREHRLASRPFSAQRRRHHSQDLKVMAGASLLTFHKEET